MEGQWASWDLERNGVKNRNWCQLAKDKLLLQSTKGPEYGLFTCPVSMAI